MTLNPPVTIVAIDDDPLQLRLLEMRLKSPYPGLLIDRVLTYTDAYEALANLPAEGAVAILCDFDMPGGSGLDWLRDLLKPDIGPVLMLTATGDESIAAQAFRDGASDYLLKTEVMSGDGQLQHAIADALRRHKLAKSNRLFARELKLANRELLEKNQRLTEMTQTAHRFVDNVAHEFRTPLTVIREFASILQDGIGGDLTEKQNQFLNYIDASARDLGTMVDDFLDSSKLKAQRLRVCRRPTPVQSVLDAVGPILESRGKAKSITLAYDVEAGLPEVYIDAEKIGRVVVNLVVNAIKFSADGGEVRIQVEADGNGRVRIAVRDFGVGIAEDELPKLCGRFTQVGDPRRSIAKGFGLGLNIARDLIWLNLGQMQIESELTRGSTFSFTVPVNDPEVVLTHYLKRVLDSDEQEPVSMLRLRAINPTVTLDDLLGDLSGVTRSMDLVLPTPDGSAVFVVGATDEPDAWIEKLEQAAVEAGQRRDRPNPINLQWLGTWAQKEAAASALPMILNHRFLEDRNCA